MAMARFGATMTEQQPLAAGRIQTHRHQRGDRADKAVDQNCNTLLGTAQISPHQRGNFKAADTGQRPQRVICLQAMQLQRAHVELRMPAR